MELSAALWSITNDHPKNRRAVADAGGVPVPIAALEDPTPCVHTHVHPSCVWHVHVMYAQVLIALLEDHPDIHREAAGALWSLSVVEHAPRACMHMCIPHVYGMRMACVHRWSLSVDTENQKLIAQAAGIAKLIQLLKPAKLGASAHSPSAEVLRAQETASGALHTLTTRPENRDLIAEAEGITHLVPLMNADAC